MKVRVVMVFTDGEGEHEGVFREFEKMSHNEVAALLEAIRRFTEEVDVVAYVRPSRWRSGGD